MSDLCGMKLYACACTNEIGTCGGVHRCASDGCKGTWNDSGFPLTDPFGMTYDEFMEGFYDG